MTNHWIDLKNSDCILIMGSNAAENHPISFKWVLKAQDKGASIIHVDPRFTRTSAMADMHAFIRSGSDLAFLGGLIKYILDKNLMFKEYVVNNTNASFIVSDKYSFKDGIFSGYDSKTGKYDKSSWAFAQDDKGLPKKDKTLKNPRCVYQLLKTHYSRYTLDKTVAMTGMSKAEITKIYDAFCATGQKGKAGSIMYAMGWTQHTIGVQNIRAMAIVQLLLGNLGMAGGGVNALRGESNVQGSTDQALLWHILPGYLGTPTNDLDSLEKYNATKAAPHLEGAKDPMSAAWWQHYPKYMSSFIKAMYPNVDVAKGYTYLPKCEKGTDYSWLTLFDVMDEGRFKGFFSWGQNPACGGANSNKTRRALGKLDWLVNVNIFDNETASFWKGPGMDSKKIKTECFFLPCAVFVEKEGSITNSGRWMQWRYQGPEPLGDSMPDGDIILKLAEKIKKLYAKDGKVPGPIQALGTETWKNEKGHFDPHMVAKLINGYFTKDVEIKGKQYKKGQQVPSFTALQADGSTASGNWLYCNSYTEEGNMSARRSLKQTPEQEKVGLYPNFSWCWPVNRRILYNRASVDEKGKPYAPEKPVIQWQGGKWIGDVPDGGWAPGTKYAFIMKPGGHAHIFGPGRADGPLPEYYEPMESPIEAHPYSTRRTNPVVLKFTGEEFANNSKYPVVCTTYRVTEHWQTGVMTRHTPWLLEAEPQMFCEMSEDLAKEKGIANGDKVILENQRGSLWAIAIVTKRLRSYTIQGKKVHQVGIPWHFGWVYPKNGGDAANLLSPSVGDPNTGIPETKAFMVNVRKA